MGYLRDDQVMAHPLDVLARCALTAHHVNESLYIFASRLPALKDIVGDRDKHGPPFMVGQAIEKVWPPFRTRGSA